MPRVLVEQLLHLMDLTFAEDRAHSLLSNLSTVREEDWLLKLPGGDRSIRDIAMHVAAAKHVYENQAFGDGALLWPQVAPMVEEHGVTLASGVEWLRRGQDLLEAALASLEDERLSEQRNVHFGGTRETRDVITTMIQHDVYHAGEINHLRALLQDTDRWRRRD